MPVTVVDESGREWPMTYRCVPHRYSYELRAGVPAAQAWHCSHAVTARPGVRCGACLDNHCSALWVCCAAQ